MSSTRYQTLQMDKPPDGSTHAGLWLDKFLVQEAGEEAKRDLVRQVAELTGSLELYERFYERWKMTLSGLGAVCKPAKVLGRLAINLGAEAVLETSIALQHTYGAPYIPGSALKGLASHFALQNLEEKEWGRETPAFQTLFGNTKNAGYVTFFDAVYIPGTGHESKPLWPDVITVHHPVYYQSGKEPPADWDNPTPIPFLTATGEYLIALTGPEKWVAAAFNLLELALKQEGIGAKTSSGYGRMAFSNPDRARTIPQLSPPAVVEVPPGYQRGVVKKFMDTFGFIQPDTPGPDLFVHINDLAAGVNTLLPRQRVIFRPGEGRKAGQIQAFDVRLAK